MCVIECVCVCVCARQTFLIGLKKSPAAPPLSSTSQVKSTFLSEENLWFIASRLNNSTITITFVVIYKLCATQQMGSVCLPVCVGGGVCLFHSLRVCLFCCQAVAVAFKGCQPHCSLPSRQIASSPFSPLPTPLQSWLPLLAGATN